MPSFDGISSKTSRKPLTIGLSNQSINSKINEFTETVSSHIHSTLNSSPVFDLGNSHSIATAYPQVSEEYASASKTLNNGLDSAYQYLSEVAHTIKISLILFLNYLGYLLNTIAFRLVFLIANTGKLVVGLPKDFSHLQNQASEFIKILLDSRLRSFWLIDTKLNVKIKLKSLIKIFSNLQVLVKNFYLLLFVGLTLFSISSGSINSTSSSSFINKAVTLSYEASPVSYNQPIATHDHGEERQNYVVAQTVKEGQSLAYIANVYDLKEETIRVNNKMSATDELKVGQTILLPAVDSYVYSSSSEITIADLARIYHVNEEDIKNLNPDIKGDKLAANTVAMIPVADLSKVGEYEKAEQDRLSAIKTAQEIAAKASAKKVTYTPTTYQNTVSQIVDTSSLGNGVVSFIKPTSGILTCAMYCYAGHVGIDIASNAMPPVYAAADGIVTRAGYSASSAYYGNWVEVAHANGYVTRYAHLNSVGVSVGMHVAQGQYLGQMGRTGNASGIHLHFEVLRNGINYNPLNFITI